MSFPAVLPEKTAPPTGAFSANQAGRTSKLHFFSTKLHSPLQELSNAVSIVSWVPGGGDPRDSRLDQYLPAPELSPYFDENPVFTVCNNEVCVGAGLKESRTVLRAN